MDAVNAAPRHRITDSGGRLGFRALVAFTVVLVAAPQEFVGSLKPLRLAFFAAIIAIACYLSIGSIAA